jgi:hypothetical protein
MDDDEQQFISIVDQLKASTMTAFISGAPDIAWNATRFTAAIHPSRN